MSRIKADLKVQMQASANDYQADMLRQAVARSRQVSIGIVGAGFAGLRCADVLTQHGAKVTLLEARDRLGGRVAQSDSLGHKVDLGPNWIHGSNDNPIQRLADQTKTTLHNWDESSSLVYDSAGRLIAADEAAEYARLMWDDGLVTEAFTYSNANQDTLDPKRNLAEFFASKADDLFEDLPAEVAARKRKTLLQYAAIWGSYVGTNHDRQSLKNFWLEECIEGENPFVAGTYAKILQAIAAPAKGRADIRLKTVVKEIRHGRTPQADGSVAKVSVRTRDNVTFDFDDVVLTTPLGWLKRNKAAFEPRLESRLSAAIDHIGYGTLDKIYVTWPTAFWTTQWEQGSRSTSEIAKHEEQEEHGMLQWLEPTYSELNPQHWGLTSMNLAALPPGTAHPTLLFYIHGDCATYVGQLVATATSKADVDAKLLDFVRPYYSLLPNFRADDPACTPVAVLATTWVNDEFAGHGSYSNFQVPLENGADDVKVMRHGMPESGLWLAGEHTAPFIAMGTSTGAYWSGEAVAHRIAQAYGLQIGHLKA